MQLQYPRVDASGNMYPILFLACVLHFSSAEEIDLGTVIFANVLFRHGDRTPIEAYPNDPYSDESLWPVPFGELTNRGKKQHLELGSWLRKRYSQLLPELYALRDIYVRSTDVDRALMSAEANLAGLYPPRNNHWIPIPVHTLPESMDNVVAANKHCARYEYELEKVTKSPEMMEIAERNKQLYEYLSKHTGKQVKDLLDCCYLRDTLLIEELYNFTLPEWTRSVYPENLTSVCKLYFTVPVKTKLLQRLKIGPLLGEMTQHLLQKSERTLSPDRKLWIYSGHDLTIIYLLRALDVFEPHIPPYAATVLMELRLDSKNQHVVTIWYKNSTDPILLKLPGCKSACPLTKFVELTKDLIPEDWEQECSME